MRRRPRALQPRYLRDSRTENSGSGFESYTADRLRLPRPSYRTAPSLLLSPLSARGDAGGRSTHHAEGLRDNAGQARIGRAFAGSARGAGPNGRLLRRSSPSACRMAHTVWAERGSLPERAERQSRSPRDRRLAAAAPRRAPLPPCVGPAGRAWRSGRTRPARREARAPLFTIHSTSALKLARARGPVILAFSRIAIHLPRCCKGIKKGGYFANAAFSAGLGNDVSRTVRRASIVRAEVI
jgi:hypothetical protein